MTHAAPRAQTTAKPVGITPTASPIQKTVSPYTNEGAIVEDVEVHYTYHSDGTGSMVKHLRVKVKDEAGAKAFSVLSIAYASSTQTAKMLGVTVTHPDGTKVKTPASDDMDMPAQVTQQAPLYSDLKVLQVPVRGLRPGDMLDYTMRIEMTKPQAPEEFWGDESFLTTLVVLKGAVTLDVPVSKHVRVWDPGLTPVVTVANGRKVYRWTYAQTKPTQDLEKHKPVSESDVKPSVAWTTFANWRAVGAWYRTLADPRAVPTAAIVAKANEITAKAKTPAEQVRAIYDFVSTHIRYIGVDFGVGWYQPHPAEVVLANQYGDCKDKDTLLEALLHAKGFKTAPALIGVGIKMIPDLPMPALFNHVITTVTMNGQQIWLDSTPEVAPFRMLVSGVRDKQALVIPADGPAKLERTPAKPPFPLMDRMDAVATLTAHGNLKAHMVIEDRSDSELLLRAVARSVAPAQWDKAVQYLSRLMGFGGTVSNSQFEHVENLNLPIRLTYDYAHPKFGDWAELRILPLFPTLGLPAVPDKEPETAIKLGAERTEIATTVFHLPIRFRTNLPDAVHVKAAFATFDETYSFANGELTAKRKVVVLASKIPAREWKDYQTFVKATSLFNLTYIQLLTNGPVQGSGTMGAGHAASNQTAAQLVTEADGLEKSGDYAGVLKLLDEAKAIAARQAYLWSNYGWVAMAQNKLPEALKDFERELKHHPDERYVSWLYATALLRNGEIDTAMEVLQAVVEKDPADDRAALMLASLKAQTDLPGAIAMLQQAMAAKPEDGEVAAELAELLIRNHESDKAAPLLEKALGETADAATLNNESYELARTGKDPALAEEKSREAVNEWEAQTAQTPVAGANEQSFANAMLLAAAWDTLGYILMKEGQLREARNYLEAAWNNGQNPAVGLHYGKVLEKQGESAKALRIYELSLGMDLLTTKARLAYEQATGKKLMVAPPEGQKQLTAAIEQMKKAHLRYVGKNPELALQSMRTFHLLAATAPKKLERGIFRLEFLADGPPQVMQLNGGAWLGHLARQIRAAHFPRLVPEGSKARLVRDAAVSCSSGDRHCVLVLMPMGGMQAENMSIPN